MKWVYLVLAIVGEVVGTSALKGAEGFTRLWPSLISIAGYVVAFYFLSLSLKDIPVGIAYAMWSAIGIVIVSIVGYFLYDQKIDLPAMVGIGFRK